MCVFSEQVLVTRDGFRCKLYLHPRLKSVSHCACLSVSTYFFPSTVACRGGDIYFPCTPVFVLVVSCVRVFVCECVLYLCVFVGVLICLLFAPVFSDFTT